MMSIASQYIRGARAVPLAEFKIYPLEEKGVLSVESVLASSGKTGDDTITRAETMVKTN